MCPDKKQKFHRIVAQLFYILKRARPDLAPAVPFLTTRVCDPTDDDWLKLRHLIEYLTATKDLCLTLEVDKSKNPVFSIDAAHQVHGDCKGHTGGSFTMGKGSIFTVSCKQKINTRSSTEAELVAVYDCLSHLLWLRNFLLAQGFEMARTIQVLQDNQSAILLEQNGILSSTQRTKHLKSRYFYVKDRVDNKEIEIVWCPTDKVVSDYLTKPLTGEKFYHFRLKIMNMKELKMENLGPKEPKSTSLSQVGSKAERAVSRLRKDAIRNLKNRLSNAGSGNSGLKEWSVEHTKATRYQGTDWEGPAWNRVKSRTTYDLTNGNNSIIEHITIDKGVGAATLYRKLPPNVSHIRTVLQYREEPEEDIVKKDMLNSVSKPEFKKYNVKGCYSCGPVGHPTRSWKTTKEITSENVKRNKFLANRRGKGCKKRKDSHSKEPPDSGISL